MDRIYHHHLKWEDYKSGFYDTCSGDEKKIKIEKAIEMFSDESLTTEYMKKAVREWKYSCEHNLTNPSVNKIAYIGQAACCIYSNIPSNVTKEAWNMLSQDIQDRSNKIAEETINEWLKRNKEVQLCLNII